MAVWDLHRGRRTVPVTYVKQGDTWHVVDPEGKRDPNERRPHKRARCGALLHCGEYDEPIDEEPEICEACK